MDREPTYADVPTLKPRYSLRGLLLTVTGLGMLLGALSAPDLIALPVLVIAFWALPALLILGIARGHLVGYRRAFAVGVLVAMALLIPLFVYSLLVKDYASPYEQHFPTALSRWLYNVTMSLRISALALAVVGPVIGAIAVAFRWGQLMADVARERARMPEKESGDDIDE